MPETRDSTMACPRVGTSFGRLMAMRIAMSRMRATIQLVTMLFVTGRGPSLNRACAAGSTPAAKAGTAVVSAANIRANLVTRNMDQAGRWEAWKGLVVGNRPSVGQQPKPKKGVTFPPGPGFQALEAFRVLWTVIIATAPMVMAVARMILEFMGSPRISQPRNTATTGFT